MSLLVTGHEIFDMIYRVFLREGDEVIQQTPCFCIYKLRCDLYGEKLFQSRWNRKDKQWSMTPEGIVKAVTNKTKVSCHC